MTLVFGGTQTFSGSLLLRLVKHIGESTFAAVLPEKQKSYKFNNSAGRERAK
jgi:hypothetical protein